MPFHFCHEELYMMMAAVPGLGLLGAWLRAKIHKHLECHVHEDKADKLLRELEHTHSSDCRHD